MPPTQEASFVQPNPVWIVSAKKKDDNKIGSDKNASRGKQLVFPVPHYPYYNYLYQDPTPAEKDGHDKGKNDSKDKDKAKERTVVMKVDICCSECEETVRVAMGELKGVKSVECNSFREKVTVVVTTAAPADVLMKCKKLFRTSRMWSDDD